MRTFTDGGFSRYGGELLANKNFLADSFFFFLPSFYWDKLNSKHERHRRLYYEFLYCYALDMYIRVCLFGVSVCLILCVSLIMMMKVQTPIIIIIIIIIM
jgi:hypothetical protein